jgi:hypothetical protein
MQITIQYGATSPHRHTGAFLFVISHMRSFSSLLCHILGSHPEISGYGEAQISYFGRNDLDRLARAVREQNDKPEFGRFVLDKILHNARAIAPGVLARPDVHCVFLLRNAADTMASILNMARSQGHTGLLSDPRQVTEYYVLRVQQMQQYATQTGRAIFVDADRLIADTDAVLGALSRSLSLATALSPEYQTFKMTGKRGHGDPSPNILTRNVVRSAEERHRDYVSIPIPDDCLARGEAAYAACRDALARCGNVA